MNFPSARSSGATALWYHMRTIELADALVHPNLVLRVVELFRIQCL
jgi:hypothetical protein